MKKLLMALMAGICLSIFSCTNDRGNQNGNDSDMYENEGTRDNTENEGTNTEDNRGTDTRGRTDTAGSMHNKKNY